jgi:hypothetical protein
MAVKANQAVAFDTMLTVCRHLGLWPGGCPEPALRAMDISWSQM